jgi:hypothetical protein
MVDLCNIQLTSILPGPQNIFPVAVNTVLESLCGSLSVLKVVKMARNVSCAFNSIKFNSIYSHPYCYKCNIWTSHIIFHIHSNTLLYNTLLLQFKILKLYDTLTYQENNKIHVFIVHSSPPSISHRKWL